MSLFDPYVRNVLLTCVSDNNVRLYVVHPSDNPELLGIVYLYKDVSCVIPAVDTAFILFNSTTTTPFIYFQYCFTLFLFSSLLLVTLSLSQLSLF
jgi:hypothetical protein